MEILHFFALKWLVTMSYILFAAHTLPDTRVSADRVCGWKGLQDVASVLKARVKVVLPGVPGRSGPYHAWRIYWAKKLSAESHLRAKDSVRNTNPRAEAQHQQGNTLHSLLAWVDSKRMNVQLIFFPVLLFCDPSLFWYFLCFSHC